MNTEPMTGTTTDPLRAIRARADRIMRPVLGLHLVYCLALAPWHDSYSAFLLVGIPAAVIPLLLIWRLPGREITRMTVAACFMVLTALAIHQARGMTEMHFGFFVLFAFLLFYRDWRVYLPAVLIVVSHHAGFNYLQQINLGVFCFTQTGWDVVAIHIGYVLIGTAMLMYLAEIMRRETMESNAALRASDDVNRNLKKLAAGVRDAASDMTASVEQVASGNSAISQRAEQQAATLQETAASMEELTITVKRNAEHALEANALATGASEVALKGGEAVGAVVQTMAGISDSSRKIADIISLIDSIAFQTNILALNAAVEAARAGEQGRGFAVVASEVRSLAQRSADAAKEIKGLIHASVNTVDAGARLVEQAGNTMQEIVLSVQGVSEIIAQIATASREQSMGIEQVNKAVVQLEEATQQNASVVEKTAAATDSMRRQAASMLDTISRFNLGDTPRRETHTPVEPAPSAMQSPPSRGAKPRIAGVPHARLPQPGASGKTHGNDEWKSF